MGKISDAAASKALKDVLGNVCFSKATLAINAASAATIKTTGTTTYTVGGAFYTKAALSAQSIAIAANYGPVNGTEATFNPLARSSTTSYRSTQRALCTCAKART